MSKCSTCDNETNDNQQQCTDCKDAAASSTWKKQIRLYSVLILIGAGLFAYAINQIQALPRGAAAEGMPPMLMATAALGGLGILGGLFGLALAIFFNFLHRSK